MCCCCVRARRSVFSYHFYIPPQIAAPLQFEVKNADRKNLKSGWMLTEFQIALGDSMNQTFELTDQYMQSWLVTIDLTLRPRAAPP